MAQKAKNAAYAALVAEAEAAVAAVKDPELRCVAFEKILTTLLEGATAAAPAGRAKRENRGSSQAGGGKASVATRSGPKAYIEMLIDEGFFKKQRTLAEVKAELANRAHHVAITSLSGPMGRLTQERRLRRQKVTANSKGTKTTYAYSNW